MTQSGHSGYGPALLELMRRRTTKLVQTDCGVSRDREAPAGLFFVSLNFFSAVGMGRQHQPTAPFALARLLAVIKPMQP
jgi:hypothetical protein